MALYPVYIGKDNTFNLILTEDDVAVDLSAVTKISIVINGTEYDSTTYSDAFDWTSGGLATGEVEFKLGNISALDTPLRDRKAELLVYAPTFTNGKMWSYLDIQVREVTT